MSFKGLHAVPRVPAFGDAALLILRIVAGLAFMFHGWGKIQNPMGWMGPDTAVPGIFQALAAIAEFFGGLAWILGALTPIASFGLLCTMAVAVYFHAGVLGDPFVASGAGQSSYEPAAIFLCISLVLMAVGPGSFSVDAKVFGRK